MSSGITLCVYVYEMWSALNCDPKQGPSLLRYKDIYTHLYNFGILGTYYRYYFPRFLYHEHFLYKYLLKIYF